MAYRWRYEGDYSFDDLESGGSSYAPPVVRKISPARSSAPLREEAPEEQTDGELAVDVYQTPTHIIIKAMIAGVKPEDLDVSITRDMVTIRGKREQHVEGTAGRLFLSRVVLGYL